MTTDKRSDEQRLADADEAERLLGDRVFNGVIKAIIADALVELTGCLPGSNEAFSAHCTLLSMEKIKQRLTALKNDGAILRKQLEDRNA